jgi:hemerythrin-like domain-containing protein
MSDVIEQIEHDHREVEQMFSQFRSDPSKDLALQICDELERHTRAEDEAVYPRFAQDLSNERDKVDEAAEEHHEARQLIGRIRNTVDIDHLVDLMAQLEQAIQHHVQEEESEMLPKARRELPAEELDEIGSDFEAAKQQS